MKKRLLLLAFAVAAAFGAYAQNDSLTFVNAQWKVKKVGKGITLKEYHFTGDQKIFDSNQYVSIVEIDAKKAKGRFALASNLGYITPTSKFAKDSGAVVAMNGSFYNMKKPYNSVCYFKKHGVEEFVFNEKMAQRDNGAVAISAKGKLSVHPADASEPGNVAPAQTWPAALDAVSVVSSGPVLLVDGKDARLDENSFNRNRHPRSAVGTAGKKVYLVTVDGRNAENAQGVSLWEFTKIMRWIGAEDALNMDGGGSTTLYVEGENGNGIVNHPSDNKKFDRQGERHVVNSLLFIR
ncbi:MAG: phosphodiester glycosidase family protein [Bacteroidales bacterium]|nr:phosphodiester glycosidase family protein [Bacteroidales bacterium]MBQ5593522.1 phosphodiester glycosidase family protein [Bacteroidales bacterium]